MYNYSAMQRKKEITTQLNSAIKSLELENLAVHIEIPEDIKHGDYTTNIAMIAAGRLKKDPLEVAETIKKQLEEKHLEFIDRIEVVKPGFINFWISQKFLIQELQKTLTEETMQISHSGKGRRVIVEYSSPNIAKPFTIGHLRSTIIGDAIANLLESTGWEVYRDNHVGDWGTQFGKQIYSIIHLGEGSLEKNLEKIEHSERPIKELVNLYVEFHEKAEQNPKMEDEAREWFKKLEEGDSEARKLWQKCIDWSWKEFDAIYKELGVPSWKGAEFDNNGKGYGESFFEDKMEAVIKELKEKKLLTQSEGAQVVFFPNNQYPPLMILKKDGSTLYSTRDLATDKFRLEKYGKDIIVINEVGAEQSLYFYQLFKLEEMLGWYQKGQRVHLKHGLYRFKDEKMSTRKGNVIWLEDVLQEAIKKAHDIAMRVAEVQINSDRVFIKPNSMLDGDSIRKAVIKQVAIGALKWNDLKRSSQQDIVFDWEDILNMYGNSGPYLQYTYVRTQSVLEKVHSSQFTVHNVEDIFLQEEEVLLLRKLNQFTDVVEEAAEQYAPHIVAMYLFDLCQTFNLFYQKFPILKVDGKVRNLRLLLTSATGQTVKKGLFLLGIEAPRKM